MLTHSSRKFQIRAVTAGTARLTFLTLDGHFFTMDAIFAGANRFARAGHHEQLGWPPGLIFAEYGPAFTKHSGSLGYAKPVSFKGHIMSANLINTPEDHLAAERLLQRFIGEEINSFRRWLKTRDHPQRADWPQQVRQLEQLLNAFSNHKMTYDDVLQAFISRFDQGSARQQVRLHKRVQYAREIHDRYVKALNARLPVAILLINIQNVEHYNYSDDRDLLFNTEKVDADLRKTGDLLSVMFTRVNQQKAQFKRDGIPFYQPEWLATQHARDQPIWDPQQLDAYHLKE
ncbi:hypothetical protein [Lacticaseibacillus porcinae]|uniref:hypothetical protein n=1 Tax=Lacticaseibacillus porcinae TaxID=1123687 RepID=UPI000F776CE1|nr:hypothetical protein [Lacticaseibacillus porcinae]